MKQDKKKELENNTNTSKSTSPEASAKKKSYGLLIVSAVVLIASIAFVIYAYNTSYQASLQTKSEISALKKMAAELESSNTTQVKEALAELNNRKLTEERPYSYGLTILFFSVVLLFKGIYNACVGVKIKKADVRKLALAGLMAALCYIGFAIFKIDIPVGTEKTAFHFGNVFCVLAALLIGGYWGGLAGAIGMTIGDLTTAYVTSAPKTFLLKLLIGLIVGFFAHKVFRLSKAHSAKYITGATIASCILGMAFNVVADPVVGYFYKQYLLGVPQDLAAALAKMSAITTFVNAIICVIAASIFYLALRPALKKSGLFEQVTPAEVAEATKNNN